MAATSRAWKLGRALLVLVVVGSLLSIQPPTPAGAAGTDMVFVTGDGTLGAARDADRAALFTSFGYTITVVDDDTDQPTLDALALTHDVVFLANSVLSFSLVQNRLRSVDIGIVSEDTGTWGGLMYFGGSSSGAVSNTDLDFVGPVPGASSSPVGSTAVYSPASGLSYWPSGTNPLPAGASVAAEVVGSPDQDALFSVDTGGALYSANTAANRRVFTPFGNSEVSQWTATTTNVMQDLLAWAAGSFLVVNSTGDAVDSNPGDGVCDTGGTNSAGAPECTLRAAIQEANATANLDAIEFDIPVSDSGHAAGVWTIDPSTPFDEFSSTVVIDGSTQAGHVANTTSFPALMDSSLAIQLDGSALPADSSGLVFGVNASDSVVRGLSVVGVAGPGIEIDGSDRVSVVGNHLGVGADGTTVVGNIVGVDIRDLGGAETRVGSALPGDRNMITGNTYAGIALNGPSTTDTVVQGNDIGLLRSGPAPVVPSFGIVAFNGSGGTLVGGTGPGEGNRITRQVYGLVFDANSANSFGAVVGNHMWANALSGIDNLLDGDTPNDVGDGDVGPNDLLNYPDLTEVTESGGTVTVTFDLDVPVHGEQYRVEFFTNPSGADTYGEGELLASSIVTGPGTGLTHSFAGAPGEVVTATSTRINSASTHGFDRTSEFSLAVTACGDADSDGLLDCEEDANTDADNDPTTTPGPDTDGDTTPNYLDADDDGDGTPTASEDADPNGDGDPRDALDSDRDGQPDYLDVPTTAARGWIQDEQKISATEGGFSGTLDAEDQFNRPVAIGDLDGDGVVDMAVGATGDDDGGPNRGAVYILFLNADGTVKAEQKISDGTGGLAVALDDERRFGAAVGAAGDVDGDGVQDLLVGAPSTGNGGVETGAAYVLFLQTDGTVRQAQRISALEGGFGGALDPGDGFGTSASGLGDVNGDGVPDVIVGARFDDDGGLNRGAAWILFLNENGTVAAEQKISSTTGGLVTTLVDHDQMGAAAAGIGDVDGDGVPDAALGVILADDGGASSGAVIIAFLNSDGTVRADQRISNTQGGLSVNLPAGRIFGHGISGVGDVDLDGTPDLLVGTFDSVTGGDGRGFAYLLFLESDGSVRDHAVFSDTEGGLTGPLDDLDRFGIRVAGLGDLDGDGSMTVAIGSWGDDDGGGSFEGAVYLLDLAPLVDSDGDGLWDHEEDANTDADGDPATNPGPDTDGDLTPNYLDADDDGDGTPTASENADPNGDGDPRDALDTDRDGEPDYLDGPTTVTEGTVAALQKISDTSGGFSASLSNDDQIGRRADAIGDLDGDGITDLVIGAYPDDDGGTDRGAVYVLFLNADGSVKAEQKISDTTGGLTAALADGDWFGSGVAAIGDLDGDGVIDIAVGAARADDGGTDRGAVYVLFLNVDGTVKAEQKISDTTGGLGTVLDGPDWFGMSLAGIGDLDGDGVPDLTVGANNDDDGGPDRGAIYVLFLNSDGTVKADQKISDTSGGLVAPLDNSGYFGSSVADLGDIDGDGIIDIAVGNPLDGDGGTERGAVHILRLNTDGTVKAGQKISDTAGGLTAILDDGDRFGTSVGGIGDLDRDGVPDLAIGAFLDDDGATNAGAVYLVNLNPDGSVAAEEKLSGVGGPLSAELEGGDILGSAVTGLGDLDGNGSIDLAVGASQDDDGGTNRGAVYVLNLAVACGPGTPDSDSDGLLDCEEDANTDLDGDPSTSPGPDTDGDTLPNYLDADDDGDGTPTASENADPNGDGDPRDALDTDRDGQPDYLDLPVIGASFPIVAEQKISSTVGGLVGPLANGDQIGEGVAGIGDLDGDGTNDLIIGASGDDDGGTNTGAVYITFLNTDGTVRNEQKISATAGGLAYPIQPGDYFGHGVASVGDLDGDGRSEVAVGSWEASSGGSNRGAVDILFLNADGTVRNEQRISAIEGGLSATVDDSDRWGAVVAAPGDIDGDGFPDLLIGSPFDDDGQVDAGAAAILFLNADGTVRDEQKISALEGGLPITLEASDQFGFGVTGLDDVNGDGTPDVAVGIENGGINDDGSFVVLLLNPDGTVLAGQEVGEGIGGFVGTLDPNATFGREIQGVGDLDGDGTVDVIATAVRNDGRGSDRGAIHLLSLNDDGTVLAQQELSDGVGGLVGPLDDGDQFGSRVAVLGDLDGDGTISLAVGARFDDDGGSDRGAVYVVELCGRIDSDGDGLWDCEEDANTDLDGDPATNPGPDSDGDTTPNYLDADDDGDGTPTAGENADPNSDGDPRDALDLDRDGEPDYLDRPTVVSSATVAEEQKVSSTAGGLTGPLGNEAFFGSVTSVGDIDGDGIVDVAVGSTGDDDGGPDRGAVFVLLMNADGTVRAEQKISDIAGGLVSGLADIDRFGASVVGPGDIDGDGVADLVVGAPLDDDGGGGDRGAVYVLFLNNDGSVRGEQKISASTGGLTATLDTNDNFGGAVAGPGDIDGDGTVDIAVGAARDGDGGSNRGAVYVLFLNGDGTVRAEQKISDAVGGFNATFDDDDRFGGGVAGIGDIDSDGIPDIAVGVQLDDDGGSNRGAVHILRLNSDGTVAAEQKISSSVGGLGAAIDNGDRFGSSIAGVGDLDNDGVVDIAVGSPFDGDGGWRRGALHVLFLNADGTVRTEQKISDTTGGLAAVLDDEDVFGSSVAGVGDLDGDGTINLIVGAPGDDDGGSGRGAVYVLDLATLVDSDGDGLWDHEEDANTDADDDPATSPGPDTDGDTTPNYLDADDDDDGTLTSAENADPNGDGDPRDALDTDFDGQPDYLDAPSSRSSGEVADEQKISDLFGGLAAPLADQDAFGSSVTSVGDLDGDGVVDVAVGAPDSDRGSTGNGAVYVLLLNADGTVKAEQEISNTAGGLATTIDGFDAFGYAVAGVGDLDGDGIGDLVVGAENDDDGGNSRGAVYVLLLNADGTVKAEQKISSLTGGLTGPLDDFDRFGSSVAAIGDLDGDGVNDVAVGATLDDDGGDARGAVYVLFLNADGTVKAERKISDTAGGLLTTLDDADLFGASVAGLGDVDGDGITDLAVGVTFDDDGGSLTGAAYVLFLNANGTVKGEQKISSTTGGVTSPIGVGDQFGSAVSGVGDLDGNGVADLLVGNNSDDGGTARGAVYVLFLNADGTVLADQMISDTSGQFGATLDDLDYFGSAIASVGDLDGDLTPGLIVGAQGDDDGGVGRGAVYLIDLASAPLVVNSTGDASDLAPGDGVCDTGGTNSQGDPECTLRAAIEEANASGGGTISFDIPYADPGQSGAIWTITPTSGFAQISAPVTIDGSTQTGFASTPVIQLDGVSAGSTDAINLQPGAAGSVIRGLAIGNYEFNAIDTRADNTLIVGNHFGLDGAGTTAMPVDAELVFVENAADVVIGGTTAADRNVLGVGRNGILLSGATDTTITGNWIGTDVTGNAGVGTFGFDAIRVESGALRTVIGGAAPGAGNVIGNANDDGIDIRGADTRVEGNTIGIGLDGASLLGLQDDGIATSGSGAEVIDNVIGNAGDNSVEVSGASDITIQGNVMGSNAARTVDHGPGQENIEVRGAATSVRIGGVGPGDGNTLVNTAASFSAISILDVLADDVAILGNVIDADFLPIDLADDGPTLNDALDADGGANDLLNHPELQVTSMSTSGPGIIFTVGLDVTLDVPAGDYRIEVFSNDQPGFGGAGNGQFLAHTFAVTHPGSGAVVFPTTYSGPEPISLSATATQEFGGGLYGSTSEMSPASPQMPNAAVVNSTGTAGDLVVNGACNTGALNAEGAPECTLRAAIQHVNRTSNGTIDFAIPTSDPGYISADQYWLIHMGGIAYEELLGFGMTIDGSSQPGYDGTGPVVHVRSAGGDALDIVADDITVQDLAIGNPADDAIQIRGDRVVVDRMWLGLDPTGAADGSPSTSNEGIIVYDGSVDTRVTNSRISDFDSGIVSNSGTIDITVEDTEIFGNRNGGVVFNNAGRVTLSRNSIHDNDGLGFELGALSDGVPLPNDVGDGDSGGNDLLNTPVLTNSTVGAGTVDIDYTIDVPAGTYRIEFFDSDRPDPTGFGEGQTFLSAETIVHPGGSANYTATVTAVAGDVITATTTPDLGGGSYGGTSEFSNASLIGIVFVNSTGDAGDLAPGDGNCDTGATNADGFVECTLRAAIEEANASADVDIIHFQIPETDPNHTGGTWTITPTAILPVITLAVTLDASTQPGWAGAPLVGVDGTGYAPTPGNGDDGLASVASDTTIRGLSIFGFADEQVNVSNDRAVLQSNWLGVTPSGTVLASASPASGDRLIQLAGDDSLVGGPADADGNVFAAGSAQGVFLSGTASGTIIEGNHFGVAADGVTPIGTATTYVVEFTDSTSGTMVRSNQFANLAQGAIRMSGNSDAVIIGNIFGTDVTLTVSLPVEEALVVLGAASAQFGGAGPGGGNIVRNATAEAVAHNAVATGNVTLLGNSIQGSGGLAFDLGENGVTLNDGGDGDTGSNDYLNFPEIASATTAGGTTAITFSLDVPAGDYRIEAFSNPSGADPSGFGEGEEFLGATTITHLGGGARTFEMIVTGEAVHLSMTATEDLGGGSFGATSEFSGTATPVAAATVEDISARQTDLTAAGGSDPTVPASGIGGAGINLDGGLERLVGPPTDITSNAFTMSAWVNLDTAGNDPRIIAKGEGAGTVYDLFIDDGTSEAVGRMDIGGVLTEVRGGSVLPGAWHHVVASWNGGTLTLFVDGTVVDTAGAVGSLTVDLDAPLAIGNTSVGASGLDGTLDQLELHRRSFTTAEVVARFRNGQNPAAFVSIGAAQTAAPAPWTTSGVQARTGGNALAAPVTNPGADAWVTAVGVDEPGVEMTAWWWVSNPNITDVAAGTRTGPAATDQFDASATSTGLDLAELAGATRTSVDTDPTTLAAGTWQQVVMTTDELGNTTFALDGTVRLGPTALSGEPSGSVGFRAADIFGGEQWFIDDVMVRRLVSDEPTTSLGPLERN